MSNKIKIETKKKIRSETEYNFYHEETLEKHISDILIIMDTNIDLFETLSCCIRLVSVL